MCNSIHFRAAEKKAFVGILSQIHVKLLFGPLVILILVQYRSKVSYHLSSRFSRDETLVSRDDSHL